MFLDYSRILKGLIVNNDSFELICIFLVYYHAIMLWLACVSDDCLSVRLIMSALKLSSG
uniref:Uncharacterized protein n=1 Tax=Arundo donax TaxID=35708 RepID=A0A0A9APF4_ARUDO